MRQIKLTYVALFVGLTLLWLLVDSFVMAHYQIWPLRKVMVHYSGVLGIAAMSVAVILAARPRRFERFFDGLDKTYRLHKWLGIAALVISIVHWAWGQVPKWLVGAGWLEKPVRHAGPPPEGIFGLLRRFRGLAEDVGEALGCGAYVAALRRLGSGPYQSPAMVTLERLEALAAEGTAALDEVILPVESALEDWPGIRVPEDMAYYLRQGQAVLVPRAPTRGWVRLYGGDARLLGLGEVLDDGRIAPRRLFHPPA